MAPVTFHLVLATQPEDFLSALEALPAASRPIYVGEVHHWMHAPTTLSTAGLIGSGATMKQWHHLIIHTASSPQALSLPPGLDDHVQEKWSITSEISDDILSSYTTALAPRLASTPPPLPPGWSASDTSGLDASVPPPDLEVSLGLQSHAFGADRETEKPVVLKDWIRSFGQTHTGPVQMLNLDSCNPGRRPDFYGYIVAFGDVGGKIYGGGATLFTFGHDVTEWSSREGEGEMTVAQAKEKGEGYGTREGPVVGWEDVALVSYPSIWHFAKLLDDPRYAEADRKYKIGVLRDGPLVCCTEVDVHYAE
ncbi:hypothetical protein LTR53_013697 [Teratosphaeriaceae sp. CCFEE 6253]|nr:hypothetical protein LTR53_013697 [Teratosphaeriaceae sp. CCFEE 6253]